MKKNYYLFNPGRLSRKDNTLKFLPVDEEGNEGQPKYIPVEDVDNLYVFGSLDANSALYNFLGKQGIGVHFFDYYEHYTGSFMPKEYLLAGQMQVAQTRHYLKKSNRLAIAKKLIEGAGANMLKNLRYYHNREKDLQIQIEKIELYMQSLSPSIVQSTEPSGPQPNNISVPQSIPELMGLEGNIRQVYYESFDTILNDFVMGNRNRQPPLNEINALISFGNMLCYTACLDAIYHTQLNPTISFLHEPGARRYSLALDLAEIFKPILVDRLIFSLVNKRQLQHDDFEINFNSCILKEKGRKVFLKAWDEKLKDLIEHRGLKKKVSYKYLIRLECYKLSKHLLGIDNYEYKPFKMWW